MRSILLASFSLLTIAPDADAQALRPDRPAYTIKSMQTDECITGTEPNGWPFQGVVLARCDPSFPKAQLWHFDQIPGQPHATYRIANASTGFAIKASVPNDLVNALRVKSNAYDPREGFQLRAVHYLHSMYAGCLDAFYLDWRYGPYVGIWECHRGRNQMWLISRRAGH